MIGKSAPRHRTTERYRAAQGRNDYTNLPHDLAARPAGKFQFERINDPQAGEDNLSGPGTGYLVFSRWDSMWPDWITGGLGSVISQGTVFFPSSFSFSGIAITPGIGFPEEAPFIQARKLTLS